MLRLRLKAFWVGFFVLCLSIWHRKKGLNFLFCAARNIFLFVCGSFLSSWRGRVGTSLYLYMRKIDDIADGDVSPPYGYSIDEYIEERMQAVSAVLSGDMENVDEEEVLLVHIIRESHYDIRQWIKDIWEVFLFDYNKRSLKRPASREQLVEMATKQDVAILSIFASLGVDPQKEPAHFRAAQEKFGELNGFMTRQDWVIDLFEDLAEGSINIPREILTENRIDVPTLLSCKTQEGLFAFPGLESWYIREVVEMREDWNRATREFLPELLGLFSNVLIRYTIQAMFYEWKKKFEKTCGKEN